MGTFSHYQVFFFLFSFFYSFFLFFFRHALSKASKNWFMTQNCFSPRKSLVKGERFIRFEEKPEYTKYFYLHFFFMIKKIQLQNIQIFVYFQPSKGSVSSTISYNLCFLNVLSSNLFLRIHCSFLLYAL